MFMKAKVCISGVHGVGKSRICEKIKLKLYDNYFATEKLKIKKDSKYGLTEIYYNFNTKFALIPGQLREVVKNILHIKKQTEEVTLATYGKQLYLENLYTAQGKNILCDRSVLDTFIYFRYFLNQNKDSDCSCEDFSFEELGYYNLSSIFDSACNFMGSYSKIYLIEPSERKIESDGFRLTDKKQQLEIHKLFLSYFKGLDNVKNVKIVNQEYANTEEFIKEVASEFIL